MFTLVGEAQTVAVRTHLLPLLPTPPHDNSSADLQLFSSHIEHGTIVDGYNQATTETVLSVFSLNPLDGISPESLHMPLAQPLTELHYTTLLPLSQPIDYTTTIPLNNDNNIITATDTNAFFANDVLQDNTNFDTSTINSLNTNLHSIKLNNNNSLANGNHTGSTITSNDEISQLSRLLDLPPSPDISFSGSHDDFDQYVLSLAGGGSDF